MKIHAKGQTIVPKPTPKITDPMQNANILSPTDSIVASAGDSFTSIPKNMPPRCIPAYTINGMNGGKLIFAAAAATILLSPIN